MSTLSAGEIEDRSRSLLDLVSPCRLCPHECGVDRTRGEKGRCRTGVGAVLRAAVPHFGEEPGIAGERGSGAMFFGSCNLRCVYCQNHQISQPAAPWRFDPTPTHAIASAMLSLQRAGCHNINLVTPSHVVPFAVAALGTAVDRGLDLPVVYNTASYDGIETITLLEGVVDVYLADLRYSDDDTAARLSGAPGYVGAARAAVLEMARQVGTGNVVGPDGVIEKGLIVRLLVLPNDIAGIRETLAFLRDEVGTSVTVALMSQYYPANRASTDPLLSRTVHYGEYARVLEVAESMGFENALVQRMEARGTYRPDFERLDRPFDDAHSVFRSGGTGPSTS